MARAVKALIAGGIVGGLVWAIREYQRDLERQQQPAQIIPAAQPRERKPNPFQDALIGVLGNALGDLLDNAGPTPTPTPQPAPPAPSGGGFGAWFGGLLSPGAQADTTDATPVGQRRASTNGAGNYGPILTLIKKHESRGDYNVVWNGIAAQDRPPKRLTGMTIAEVLAWQDSIDSRYMSEAAGAYQILEDTLRGLYASAGLRGSDLFNVANQDRLAIALLRRRGLDQYEAGTITDVKFADNLAKEWASLPAQIKDKRGRPATGQSYYAGDGLNKSLTPRATVLAAVRKI